MKRNTEGILRFKRAPQTKGGARWKIRISIPRFCRKAVVYCSMMACQTGIAAIKQGGIAFLEAVFRLLSEPGGIQVFIMLFVCITAFIFRFCTRKISRIYSVICLCAYGVSLAYIALLSRTPVLNTRINLIPFQPDVNTTWWDYLANIAMFIPFPILLYGIIQRKTNGWILAGAGAGLSLLIEIIQYFTHRGICDIDDFFSIASAQS